MQRNHYKYMQEIAEHPFNRARKARSLLRYLAWNLGRRMLSRADYSIELLPGTRILVSNRENFATLVYTCGLYDFEDMLFLLHFLRPGDWFGDFGANVGVYSVLAGTRGASVLAVEPVPDTFERLCVNLRMNSVQAVPVNCGLSDRTQVLSFTSDRGAMNKVATRAGPNTFQVEVVRADELVRQTNSAPCLLKVDVEGYEWPLLNGAVDLLSTSLLAIIVEMNESGREYGYSDESVHSFLRSSGFSPYRYDPFSRKLFAREGINRESFNTLYLKDSAMPTLRERVMGAESVSLPIGNV
jgi:FkbM family methyltransferase